MWVEPDAIEFSGSEPHIYRTHGDSGCRKLCAFCRVCGTRLYHAGGGARAEGSTALSMKAGTLGDTSATAPTSHLWTKRAHAWLKPAHERGVCFDTEPDSEKTLRAQWRDR